MGGSVVGRLCSKEKKGRVMLCVGCGSKNLYCSLYNLYFHIFCFIFLDLRLIGENNVAAFLKNFNTTKIVGVFSL